MISVPFPGRALLPLAAALLLPAAPGLMAQGNADTKAFERALGHIEELENICYLLSQTKTTEARGALAKIQRRLRDGILADATRNPEDTALLLRLSKKRIGKLSFNHETGDLVEVCRLLQIVTGIPIVLTGEAQQLVVAERLVVVLEIKDTIPVRRFLDIVAGLSEALVWRVRDGQIVFTTAAAEAARANTVEAAAKTAPENKAVHAKLEETRVMHRFTRAALADWADFYAGVTGISFVVSPTARAVDPKRTTLTDFHLKKTPVNEALDTIAKKTGLKWVVRSGTVHVLADGPEGERARIERQLRHHEREIERLREARRRLGAGKLGAGKPGTGK